MYREWKGIEMAKSYFLRKLDSNKDAQDGDVNGLKNIWVFWIFGDWQKTGIHSIWG